MHVHPACVQHPASVDHLVYPEMEKQTAPPVVLEQVVLLMAGDTMANNDESTPQQAMHHAHQRQTHGVWGM